MTASWPSPCGSPAPAAKSRECGQQQAQHLSGVSAALFVRGNQRDQIYCEERYPCAQTVVDNDVNLMALGEHRAHYREIKHLVFVKVGTGIGCGIIIDGKLHRGVEGSAGDIGHIRLPGSDAECRCGKTGCLEAVAGGGALAEQLRHLDATTARDVAQLAAEGNLQARQAVRVAAQHIGEVLAAIVSFANPEAIVLGGSLARLNETLLA